MLYVVALGLAGLAALVHVYIFVLESLRWEDPGTRAVFGTDEATAAVTRPLAYNQGFYNLFLAIGTAAGIGLSVANRDAGLTLVVFTTACMLTAALVLARSDPDRTRAAFVQGTFPFLALLDLGVWALA